MLRDPFATWGPQRAINFSDIFNYLFFFFFACVNDDLYIIKGIKVYRNTVLCKQSTVVVVICTIGSKLVSPAVQSTMLRKPLSEYHFHTTGLM